MNEKQYRVDVLLNDQRLFYWWTQDRESAVQLAKTISIGGFIAGDDFAGTEVIGIQNIKSTIFRLNPDLVCEHCNKRLRAENTRFCVECIDPDLVCEHCNKRLRAENTRFCVECIDNLVRGGAVLTVVRMPGSRFYKANCIRCSVAMRAAFCDAHKKENYCERCDPHEGPQKGAVITPRQREKLSRTSS